MNMLVVLGMGGDSLFPHVFCVTSLFQAAGSWLLFRKFQVTVPLSNILFPRPQLYTGSPVLFP